MKLGIKREKIGDILPHETGADIIVKNDIADFLSREVPMLTRFKKSTVEIKTIDKLIITKQNLSETTIIIPSYRLDAILAETLKISRTKASELFDEERVYINGVLCKNGVKQAHFGDKITVRGKGRFELKEEIGYTKKDNIKVVVLTYS